MRPPDAATEREETMTASTLSPRLAGSASSDVLATFLRSGAVALVIAAAMVLPVLLAVQPPTDPAHNREWAVAADSISYRLGWMLRVYAVVPLLIGLVAVFITLAPTRVGRMALAATLMTFTAGGVLLAGMAYPVIVMPAAGVVIAQGGEATVLRLLDQIFAEPAWIPIFFAGLIFNVGLILVGVAVWRSGTFPRVAGALVIASGLLGIPAFLDVTAVGSATAVLTAGAALVLALGLWRQAGLQRSVAA
jgi:hypothetical protein